MVGWFLGNKETTKLRPCDDIYTCNWSFLMSILLYIHEINSVPPDPTMTVDNVTQILNKTPRDKWREVMGGGGLDIPWPLREEIQRRYSTDTEKNHACADYYVNCHPHAGWENLTLLLYFTKELALAKESKSFMSTGKNTATIL